MHTCQTLAARHGVADACQALARGEALTALLAVLLSPRFLRSCCPSACRCLALRQHASWLNGQIGKRTLEPMSFPHITTEQGEATQSHSGRASCGHYIADAACALLAACYHREQAISPIATSTMTHSL
jgi:hypothetical protein